MLGELEARFREGRGGGGLCVAETSQGVKGEKIGMQCKKEKGLKIKTIHQLLTCCRIARSVNHAYTRMYVFMGTISPVTVGMNIGHEAS